MSFMCDGIRVWFRQAIHPAYGAHCESENFLLKSDGMRLKRSKLVETEIPSPRSGASPSAQYTGVPQKKRALCIAPSTQ